MQEFLSGASRNRIGDLLLAEQTLYHLSYSPVKCRRRLCRKIRRYLDSNQFVLPSRQQESNLCTEGSILKPVFTTRQRQCLNRASRPDLSGFNRTLFHLSYQGVNF